MKKGIKENLKSDLISGISSAAGVTIGMVAGNTITNSSQAQESPETPIKNNDTLVTENSSDSPNKESTNQNVNDQHPAQHPTHDVNTGTAQENIIEEPETSSQTPHDEDHSNTEPIEQTPVTPEQPNVTVLGYNTVIDPNGSPIEIATISIDDQETIIADLDMDGYADIIAADINANGSFENEEIIDVTGDGITMEPFHSVSLENGPLWTEVSDEDYINDADINDFIA